jgi:hypothetical protein
MRPLGSMVVSMAFAFVLPAFAAAPEVRYANERLTVHAEAAPLPDVLRAVGKASGAEVRGEPAAAEPLTLTLDDVPLKDALTRILGDQSFTLTYAEDGHLRSIDLRGGPSTATPKAPTEPPAEPAGWPPTEAVRIATEKVDQWTRSDTRYPITGRLADALKTKEATFSQIAEAAVTDPDSRVRAQGLRTGLRLLEGEREIRDDFVQMIDSVDDAFLVNYVRFFMKDNASEIVAAFGRTATTAALKTRAQSVLQTLKTTPPPAP